MAQLAKNPPALWETWVQSLGWEGPLESSYPLQYSNLVNSMDCIVHGVAKNQTQLSDTSLENNDTSGQKEQVPETQEMSQTGPSNTVFPMVLIF